MKNRIQGAARAGFTLIEVLVTLVLIALLVGVVLPQVIGQLDRGEPTRLSQDIEALRSSVKMFRIDVKRWPGFVEQLVVTPGSWASDADYDSNPIPSTLQDRWAGPYLEVGGLSASNTLSFALGAEVNNAFGTETWGGNTFLQATVTGVTPDLAEEISLLIDGSTTVTTTGDSGGRIRFDGTNLLVLLVPIN